MNNQENKYIRNFSIIAHINHGKSTLADRFIELCKNIKIEKSKAQYLDSMEIERERGITIKSQCLTLNYIYKNKNYTLNLIDTPGHIDFSDEVSRSLRACEGVILLIDITKGIQAQTVANYKKAIEENLKIIVALNKIDLNIEKKNIKTEIEMILKIKDSIDISAKTGYGLKNLIEGIIENIPPPKKNITHEFFVAFIIDSWVNHYKGIDCLIKVINGSISTGDFVFLSNDIKKNYKINELGIFVPEKIQQKILKFGEIGFINLNLKDPNKLKSGTYITTEKKLCLNQQIEVNKLPTVYANIYPSNTDDFVTLKKAIEKLSLNDASLKITPSKSQIFGFGFDCGFLGLLHLEITKERLEREYKLPIIITPPNVTFKVITSNMKILHISNPSDLDNIKNVKEIQEKITLTTIISPKNYLGEILELCHSSRGIKNEIIYDNEKVYIKYKIPLSELIFNFHSKLQNITNGYASMHYELLDYEKSELHKLSILINEKKIDALEFIVHKNKIEKISKDLMEKIIKIIPRQLFEIKIQATVGKKIIKRETIKALKKNVLAKCYGGDITRKRKLLEKQKAGKKKMKKIGNVEIPHDMFIRLMDINEKK